MSELKTSNERSLAEQCADIAFKSQGVAVTRNITLGWHSLVDLIDSAIELHKVTGNETPERLPAGTEVTLLGGIWPGTPRDGWIVENIDQPRPLRYRIRHPNGSLVDVLPECITQKADDGPHCTACGRGYGLHHDMCPVQPL